MPPVNFSPDEATALALALARSGDSPFAGRLRSALRKVVGAMSPDDAYGARHLVDRVRLLGNVESERSAAAAVIEDAVMAEQVVEIDYIDRDGAGTTPPSSSKPVALVASDVAWYFVGFCRLRGGGRSFRLDRGHRGRRQPTSERRTTSTRRWPEGCPTPSGAYPCSKSDIPVIPDRTLSPRCLRIGV